MRVKPRFYVIISVILICAVGAVFFAINFFTTRVAVQSTNLLASASPSAILRTPQTTNTLKPSPGKASNTPSGGTPISSGKKVAYLTFDDGPSILTPNLLKVLKNNNVHATFFVVGKNAQSYPNALKQIANEGNAIGIHSWTHDYSYIYKNTDNFLSDFNKLKDYIVETTGVTPNVCRFPGGTNNTVCFNYNKDHIMRSIVTLVENMGFKYYDWNVSSGEANSVPPSKDQIVNNVVSQCKGKNIVVILFHDTNNQGYVDAVPEIITKLKSMGYTFETLSPDNPPDSQSKSVQYKPS